LPVDGIRNWTSGWLPAVYQGTQIRSQGTPVFNLEPVPDVSAPARENQRRFLDALNRSHLSSHPGNSELTARIRNFEIAAKMQSSVTDVMDLSKEPEHTRKLYGLVTQQGDSEYAKRCLMARRLVEQGVRFVQIFRNGQPWDTHDKNAENFAACVR
jgi:hypothetical protein